MLLVAAIHPTPVIDMAESYSPPLNPLLTLGDPGEPRTPWPDYLAMGITREHTPELIRMLMDGELYDADAESTEVWAPLHAWRALGQLGAEEAIEPLTVMLVTSTEDDWARNELPRVLGMIGGASIPPMVALLDDEDELIHFHGAEALQEMAKAHPQLRGEVVEMFTDMLDDWVNLPPVINASMIGRLAEMGETGAAPLMEEAFAANAVDVSLYGDWEDIQVMLGLIPERITPRPDYQAHFREILPSFDAFKGSAPPAPARPSRTASKAKNRRKDAKAARKRNRRK